MAQTEQADAAAALAGRKRPRSPNDWERDFVDSLDDKGHLIVKPNSDIRDLYSVIRRADQRMQQELVVDTVSHMDSNDSIVLGLVHEGILSDLRIWMKAAIADRDTKFLIRILNVLYKLPVVLESLKTAKVGSVIKELSSKAGSGGHHFDDPAVTRLADAIFTKWTNAAASGAKKAPAPAPTQPPATAAAAPAAPSPTPGSPLPALPSLSTSLSGGATLPPAEPAYFAPPVGSSFDSDDYDYWVPPVQVVDPENPDLVGITEEEMGGLLKVKGIGLPDRYGALPNGILRNRVKNIVGGRPMTDGAAGQPRRSLTITDSVQVKRFLIDDKPKWVDEQVKRAEIEAQLQQSAAEGGGAEGASSPIEEAAPEENEDHAAAFAAAKARERQLEHEKVKSALQKTDGFGALKGVLSRLKGGAGAGGVGVPARMEADPRVTSSAAWSAAPIPVLVRPPESIIPLASMEREAQQARLMRVPRVASATSDASPVPTVLPSAYTGFRANYVPAPCGAMLPPGAAEPAPPVTSYMVAPTAGMPYQPQAMMVPYAQQMPSQGMTAYPAPQQAYLPPQQPLYGQPPMTSYGQPPPAQLQYGQPIGPYGQPAQPTVGPYGQYPPAQPQPGMTPYMGQPAPGFQPPQQQQHYAQGPPPAAFQQPQPTYYQGPPYQQQQQQPPPQQQPMYPQQQQQLPPQAFHQQQVPGFQQQQQQQAPQSAYPYQQQPGPQPAYGAAPAYGSQAPVGRKSEKDDPDRVIFLRLRTGKAGTKPCVFFNTAAGCKLGDRCTFVHDPNFIPSAQEIHAISKLDKAERPADLIPQYKPGGPVVPTLGYNPYGGSAAGASAPAGPPQEYSQGYQQPYAAPQQQHPMHGAPLPPQQAVFHQQTAYGSRHSGPPPGRR